MNQKSIKSQEYADNKIIAGFQLNLTKQHSRAYPHQQSHKRQEGSIMTSA